MRRSTMSPGKTMYRLPPRILLAAFLLSGLCSLVAPRSGRSEETKEILPGFWVDDDLEKGLSLARGTGKPLLVVFRCPP